MPTKDTFLTTITTLDELEQRLNILKSTDSCHPSSQDIIKFIRHLAKQIKENLQQNNKNTDYQLLQYLQKKIEQTCEQPPLKVSFSLTQIAYIKLLLNFFNHLEEDPYLLPIPFQTIKHFQLAFALCLFEEPRELIDAWHPLRHFFEQVLKSTRAIELHPCPRSMQLLTIVQDNILEAILSEKPLRDNFAKAQKNLQTYLTQFNQELGQLTQRHINKEQSQSHLTDVRKIVKAQIGQILDNKRLPLFMVKFFDEVWQKFLYMSYLREGTDGKNWQQALKDMDYLAQSVLIKNPVTLKQQLNQNLDTIMNRIRQHSESIYNGLEADKFFINLEKIHISILTSTPLEEDFNWQHQPQSNNNQLDAKCEKHALLKKLQRGIWFRMNIRGITSNVLLIDININHNYLLFSNYSGVLVNRISCQDFALQMEQKHITRLPLDPAFSQLMQSSLPSLDRFIHDTTNIIVKQETMRSEKRQEALEQLQQEAIKNAEEAQQKISQSEKAGQQVAFDRVLIEVNNLELGETLEVRDQEKGRFICTLGLKLKSTRKLIFLDRNGRRVAEFLPEQLAEDMLTGLVKLIDLDNISQDDLDHLKWNPFSKHGKY